MPTARPIVTTPSPIMNDQAVDISVVVPVYK